MEREAEQASFLRIVDDLSQALIDMDAFRPEPVSKGGDFTFEERTSLRHAREDVMNAQVRLLKIKTRRGWS